MYKGTPNLCSIQLCIY